MDFSANSGNRQPALARSDSCGRIQSCGANGSQAEPGATPSATGLPTKPEELEAALRQRVERYWAARQARDVRTLYEMESAAQPGGWRELEEAMSLKGLPVRKVKIEEVRRGRKSQNKD